jgi:hypothetical protein
VSNHIIFFLEIIHRNFAAGSMKIGCLPRKWIFHGWFSREKSTKKPLSFFTLVLLAQATLPGAKF